MPTDPRMVAAASSPNATPVSSAALTNIYNALLDLSRRIDRVEASRTVIDPASLDGAKIAPDSINANHIIAGSIHSSEIEVGNVVASIMTVGAVNASHIDASSIRASVLDAAVLTAGNAFITNLRASILDAGVLTATNATIGTLRASIINGTQIVAQNLQAQVLTAVNAAITNLSSFGVTTGTLTADLLRTAASGARVEIGVTAGGVKGYNSGGTMTFGFDTTTGAATVGAITVTGASGTSVPASTLTGFVGGGNLLKDSSFESADPALPAALWTQNTTTISKQTTQAFHGTTALRVLWASSTGAAYSDVSAATHGAPLASLQGRPLVFSAWVYVTGTDNTTPASNTSLMADDGATTWSTPIASLTKNAWTRVVLKIAPAAGAARVRLYLTNPYSSGLNTVYYDGVQLELGDAATAYSPKADEIVYGKITTVELAVGAVQASNIQAGAIDGTKITATAIDGKTITGATFQTAAPGTARVAFDSTGFFVQTGSADTPASTKVLQINASTGLTLKAQTTLVGTMAQVQNVSWSDSGNVITYITSTKLSGNDPYGAMYTRTIAGDTSGGLDIGTLTTGGLIAAGITARWSSLSDASTRVQVQVNGAIGTRTLTLFNATEASDFLQLASTVKKKFNSGSGTCTFTAAGSSALATVTHSLGATPTSIQVTPNNNATNPVTAVVETLSSTQFQVRMYTNPSSTNISGTFTFYWMAVA